MAFNDLHPRGSGGRFTTKAKKFNLTQTSKKQKGTSGRAKNSLESNRRALKSSTIDDLDLTPTQRRFLAKLTPEQQSRLKEVYKAKLEAKARAEKEAKAKVVEDAKAKAKAEAEAEAKEQAEKKAKEEAEAKAKTEKGVKPSKRKKKTPEEVAADKAAKEASKATKASKSISESTEAKSLSKAKDQLKAFSKIPAVPLTQRYSRKLKDGLPKLPKAPTPRPAPKKSNFEVSDGKVVIWKDQPDLLKKTGGWKVKEEKNYRYEVEVEGQTLVLNKSTKSAEFEGERIHGIVSEHTKLREIEDHVLFNRFAESVAHVENFVKGKINPPAPQWTPLYHGAIDKQYLASSGYGGVEIHHIHQWAKHSFNEITGKLRYNEQTKKYEDGEITLDEAKRRQRELLRQDPEEGWVIDLAKVGQRDLVMLPKGTHIGKLFDANHPPGINFDTNKAVTYGIPEKGEGGRDWFNAWKYRFWTQYYRQESFILLGEVNRRMAEGQMSEEQAKAYWEDSKKSLDRSHKALEKAAENNKGIKKAILEDFVGERKFWNGEFKGES